MSLSAEEAAQALREVESIRTRSVQLRSYHYAAPQLMLWGVLWLIGYSATDLAPRYADRVWMGITAFWALLYLLVFARPSAIAPASNAAATSIRSAEDARIRWRFRLRFLGLYAVTCLLIFGTALIMRPQGIEMAAYVPLLLACIYMGAGIWGGGWRYVAIGAVLTVLTLAGYFLLSSHFLLLMAAGGGGALLLTGLWLRSA
jgi:hypothetical protein